VRGWLEALALLLIALFLFAALAAWVMQ